ncbi:MAG: thioredoxin [Clostridia bacterium]|nr:thioredoxin [Clostridia bacterium]
MAHKYLTLDESNFDEAIKDGVVLVDFWATWCGPCKMLAPTIEELAEDYEGRVKVCKLDVDDNQSIAMRFKVMSIPTVFIFKNGEPVKKIIGLSDKEEYAEVLDSLL